MDFAEVVKSAEEVLEEERRHPTAHYTFNASDERGLGDAMVRMLDVQQLGRERTVRPREIKEKSSWVFQSTNYSLLVALLSQLRPEQRPGFMSAVLSRFRHGSGGIRGKSTDFPAWERVTSELPLVFEFAIRNGAAKELFRTMTEAPLVLGHAVLLRYVEEVIALNFTSIDGDDYGLLSIAMDTIATNAGKALQEFRGKRSPVVSGISLSTVWFEVGLASRAIVEQCRKAKYLYLKSSLLQGVNLEINQDKTRVQDFLQKLGFDAVLVTSLNKAEQIYHTADTPFDLKSSMGHLRSFLEQMHAASLPSIPAGWGAGLQYLRSQGILSEVEERFAAALYTFISDGAVHPLIAEKEYARLARNMVIEYGLLFLTKLEKSGLRKQAATGGK